MILFRRVPDGLPFLWERRQAQPPGRWHRAGDGPVQYLADTPDGAWAEFVRHEEIVDAEDLATIRGTVWAVEMPDDGALARPELDRTTLTGDTESYAACQDEAIRLRARGARGLVAPSAALCRGEARGERVADGLQPGPDREGQVIVLFGARPDLVGWRAAVGAHPHAALLAKVRPLG